MNHQQDQSRDGPAGHRNEAHDPEALSKKLVTQREQEAGGKPDADIRSGPHRLLGASNLTG